MCLSQACTGLCGSVLVYVGVYVTRCVVVPSPGLPSDCRVVEVLEAECQARLGQFNQKDVSMVFSSSMKLHLGCQHPLTEACLAALEKNLERERHPQTLFLLLSYYRLKLRTLQPPEGANGPAASSPELLLANRWVRGGVLGTLVVPWAVWVTVYCVSIYSGAVLLSVCVSEHTTTLLCYCVVWMCQNILWYCLFCVVYVSVVRTQLLCVCVSM